jgi:hypothetical protein
MTTSEKNLAIATLERALESAKTLANIAAMSDIETGVAALRTAYDTDPATVTAAQIDTAADQVKAFRFPSLDSVRDVFTLADTEANAI